MKHASGIAMMGILATVPTSLGDDLPWRAVLTKDAIPGWGVIGTTEAWSVTDGVLHCTGEGGGWISTEKDYSDFAIDFEYKVEPAGNSGVFLRAPKAGHVSQLAMEVQILDDHAE